MCEKRVQSFGGGNNSTEPRNCRQDDNIDVIKKWVSGFDWIYVSRLRSVSSVCELGNIFFFWRLGPTRVMTSSFTTFLDHTQRSTTVGRTPLDE